VQTKEGKKMKRIYEKRKINIPLVRRIFSHFFPFLIVKEQINNHPQILKFKFSFVSQLTSSSALIG
jgi:hypothetical protein